MERQGVIYKIENIVNGKVYIGQTIQSPIRRVSAHKRDLKKGIHNNDFLQKAWNKYGETNFKFSIIEKCTEKTIDELEVKWISFYRNKKLSYNLESGGKTNKKIHKSTKEKMSIITKSHGWIGGKHPHAKKIICINTGKVYSSIIEASNDIGCNYDNVHQVCLRNNLSAKGNDGDYYQFSYYNKGEIYRLKPLNNIKEPKKVICINTKEIFNSMLEASNSTGISQSKISLVCNGKRNHAGKMQNGDFIVWAFYEDYNIKNKYSFKKTRIQCEETREKISKTNKGKFTTPSKYKCLNPKNYEVIYFGNREEVIEFLNKIGYKKAIIDNIQRCCNGKRVTAYGYKWEYA